MDYRESLLCPLSCRYVDRLAEEIYANPSDFGIIYQLVFDTEEKVAWRAAWTCQKISERYPQWFTDKQFEELTKLTISSDHGGLKRGCLSILHNLTLPDPVPVDLINACFDWMVSPKSPIAVQALSMKLLYSVCQKEPDLIPEFKAYLEAIDFECFSAGFNSTRKNVLKRLNAR